MMARKMPALVMVLGLLCAWAPFAHAQGWPDKPVRVVVANAAGSLSDTMGRLLFSKVSEELGQSFLIDNRPGAGGTVGTEQVAKSPADGYTLLIATNAMMAANPFLYSKLGYDPLRDFASVTMLAKISEVLIINGALGVRTMDEFVRLVRARPGQINYASGGNGHPTHLMMELFVSKAGLNMVHIPYKGTPPAVQALVTGEVGAFAIGAGLAQPHVQSGKVIALATIGPRTEGMLPGVQPLSSFFPDSEMVNWQALFGPRAVPRPVVDRLNGALARILALPEIRKRLAEIGLTAISSSPAELEQTIRTDQALNREIIKRIGLKLD